MTDLKIKTGTVDCHFDENYRIALANFGAGRPLFQGQRPATVIPDARFPNGFMTLRFNA